MKQQISKVALIATLAFVGIGFAGTQQAKATDCPGSSECGEPTNNCPPLLPNATNVTSIGNIPSTKFFPAPPEAHCGTIFFEDAGHTWANPCNGKQRSTQTQVQNLKRITYTIIQDGKSVEVSYLCGDQNKIQGDVLVDI